MRNFRDIPLKNKLTWMIMLTSSFILFIAALAFLVNDIVTLRRAMVENVSTISKVIGNNIVAAVAFESRNTAEEILAGLSAEPDVIAAYVFKEDGSKFASYENDGLDGSPRSDQPDNKEYLSLRNMAALPSNLDDFLALPQNLADNTSFWADHMDIFQKVMLDGEAIGLLYIEYDLREINSRLGRYAGIAAIVFILSLCIGYFLSTRLQKVISEPILKLTGAMKGISEDKKYTVRVEKENDDEIGTLVVGFNDMLKQIELRDTKLLEARRKLEERVEERTRELKNEIVERKKAEEELKAFSEKLKQSNRELRDFAHIASHDLQEPLRKVTAFGDRLNAKFGESLGDQGRDYLKRMQNAAARMSSLIEGLLNYSRVTTKAQPFEAVDLAQVAQEVISDLEIRIDQTGGAVDVKDLPTIDADPLQMRQLMQNLIGNALKFNLQDNKPEVKVYGKHLNGNSGSEGSDLYELTVEDNGIGFNEEHVDRIFGVFQRLHGRNEYEGTGIGLSVCKKITERHGGGITAKSSPGEGARFIVTLPVKQQKDAAEDSNGQPA